MCVSRKYRKYRDTKFKYKFPFAGDIYSDQIDLYALYCGCYVGRYYYACDNTKDKVSRDERDDRVDKAIRDR